ncbi:hypothetical protein [uncultured Bacteroides sp.]|uniref:hypothetical protein n=1 Tax=uncultured Bacteroides sp. TaxID=162156 RepID=UPI002AA81F73|nr:hypothetical protein [uncultured Bacteroides sp.]
MIHISYLTYDSWWDTDVDIIEALTEGYDIDVFVASPSVNYKYTRKEIDGKTKVINIKSRYRDRDLRKIFSSITLFFSFYKKYLKEKGLVYYVWGNYSGPSKLQIVS